ncbi:hypothetical protein WN51_03866 [Melipona quadrifasciata]|uniref:Uncharacterized protein n=1 Tax=Melipona quadrifasciata TaxID=166423 RepID=A0A0N0BKM4_9HYME|nr:hypothetical protein WN51_03866 [Melipona quadrifasciata]
MLHNLYPTQIIKTGTEKDTKQKILRIDMIPSEERKKVHEFSDLSLNRKELHIQQLQYCSAKFKCTQLHDKDSKFPEGSTVLNARLKHKGNVRKLSASRLSDSNCHHKHGVVSRVIETRLLDSSVLNATSHLSSTGYCILINSTMPALKDPEAPTTINGREAMVMKSWEIRRIDRLLSGVNRLLGISLNSRGFRSVFNVQTTSDQVAKFTKRQVCVCARDKDILLNSEVFEIWADFLHTEIAKLNEDLCSSRFRESE